MIAKRTAARTAAHTAARLAAALGATVLGVTALGLPIVADGAAAAAPPDEFAAALGKTGTGRCHMDSCSFFTLETSLPMAVLKDGTLFAVSELTWSAGYRPLGGKDAHEYDRPPVNVSAKTPDAFAVFCSKTRPYYFLPNGRGGWEVLALRPGDPAAVAGATETAYDTYWAACHRYLTDDPVSARLAARLGYRFSGGYPDGAESAVTKPADLLK